MSHLLSLISLSPFISFPLCLYLLQILDTPDWERPTSFTSLFWSFDLDFIVLFWSGFYKIVLTLIFVIWFIFYFFSTKWNRWMKIFHKCWLHIFLPCIIENTAVWAFLFLLSVTVVTHRWCSTHFEKLLPFSGLSITESHRLTRDDGMSCGAMLTCPWARRE